MNLNETNSSRPPCRARLFIAKACFQGFKRPDADREKTLSYQYYSFDAVYLNLKQRSGHSLKIKKFL